MDLTVLNLAVPELSADLEPTSAQLLWIVDIYGFLLAGLLITMGTLGDRIGRRRLLLIGAAAFGAASVLAAFSRSAEMLIATRALLGLAGATLAPSTLSLIRNMFFDPRQRTVAVGVWITSFSVGAAIGPLLGGIMLEFFWWGSVFLLAVPVMVLLLVLGPLLLPEFRDPDAGRLDLLSAALSLAAVLAVIYGLKQLAQDGLGWSAALSIVAGLALGAAFVRRQQRLTYPLIDLQLFRAPAFSVSVGAIYAAVFVVAGMFLFLAQYLQLVRGEDPFVAGLWLLPATGGMVVGSILAPVLVRRVSPPFALGGSLVLAAVGVAMLIQLEGSSSALAIVAVGTLVMGLGAGSVGTLATDSVVAAAPPERAGAASAISETGAEIGGALGIAVLGSIGTAVYRNEVAVPSSASPEAAEAARDTLAGAVETAEALPATAGAELLDSANAAFLSGLEVAAGVTAALVAAIAVAAAILVRRSPMRADTDAEPMVQTLL
jgi:MFS transporter, DHA2 family, multidrug resistance protein